MTTQPLTLTVSHDGGIINIDPTKVIAVEDSGPGTLIYLQVSSAVKVKENRAAVFTAWRGAINAANHGEPVTAAGGYPETHPSTQLHAAAQPA